jgi:hypothetical protein
LLHFGLGQDSEVKRILVEYTNGKTYEVNSPKINTVLNVNAERDRQVLSN